MTKDFYPDIHLDYESLYGSIDYEHQDGSILKKDDIRYMRLTLFHDSLEGASFTTFCFSDKERTKLLWQSPRLIGLGKISIRKLKVFYDSLKLSFKRLDMQNNNEHSPELTTWENVTHLIDGGHYTLPKLIHEMKRRTELNKSDPQHTLQWNPKLIEAALNYLIELEEIKSSH